MVEGLIVEDIRKGDVKGVKVNGVRNIRGMFEMNCLFLSGDFKFQVSPKVLISCPRSTPVARNAKFQPMYPLLGGVTVR